MRHLLRLFLAIFSLTLTSYVFGQGLELSTQINSGLFYYGGQSATHSTITDISYPPPYVPYMKNPYGRNSGLSYGISLQLQKTTTSNFLFGLQVGYELLTSKVDLTEVLSEEPVYAWNTSKSFITLSNQFINFNPYVGYRIVKDKFTFDLTAGTDIGLCLTSQAKIDITNSRGDNTIVKTDREKINSDIRPRIGITSFYKNYGLSIGYSYGLSNYSKTVNEPGDKIYSRYFRVGLVYRLRL